LQEPNKPYVLPDSSTIKIDKLMQECVELYFTYPGEDGAMQELVVNTILQNDKEKLHPKILLHGGGSIGPSISKKLIEEVHKYNTKIKKMVKFEINDTNDKIAAPWKGMYALSKIVGYSECLTSYKVS
jgi:hypothetical protein